MHLPAGNESESAATARASRGTALSPSSLRPISLPRPAPKQKRSGMVRCPRPKGAWARSWAAGRVCEKEKPIETPPDHESLHLPSTPTSSTMLTPSTIFSDSSRSPGASSGQVAGRLLIARTFPRGAARPRLGCSGEPAPV